MYHSGDDGFDLTTASIAMQTVRAFALVGDGLNLTTSLLQIGGRLEIDMTASTAPDREILDFEGDTGPVMVEVAQGDLRIDLRSSDMLQPQPPLFTPELDVFNGRLVSGEAQIYDGQTIALLPTRNLDAAFKGGVRVAARDGQVLVASGAGTSPTAQRFAYAAGNSNPGTLRSTLVNAQIRGFTGDTTRGLFVG